MTNQDKLAGKIGYYHSEFLSDTDIENIQKIVANFNINGEIVEFQKIKQNTPNLDVEILLCFSDTDILCLPRLLETIPAIVAVELPGDNSFFAQISLNQLEWGLQMLLNNEYERDNRDLIELTLEENVKPLIALNDVYISSSKVNTRMRYDLLIKNKSIFDNADSANGLLISTPTGSTAMSMNLGGAIIQPDAQVFQIQAIASRNYLSRQQIVSNQSEMTIEILDAIYPLVIQVDNQQITTHCKEMYVKKAEKQMIFLTFDTKTTKKTLENKLRDKISFEDTQNLTSSAKFILHVLHTQDRAMTVNEMMEITHINNQKTMRSSLKLLISKGFVRRKDNFQDMREHLYHLLK